MCIARGKEPSRLRVASPGQRSCAIVCLASVLVLLRAHVSAPCLFCCHLVSAWVFAVLIATLRTAKCWDTTFGVIISCWDSCLAFAPTGAVPAVGGYLYPSVLRSPGVTPQRCRAAHGPRHPAVTTPLRLCLLGAWFCCLVLSGFLSGLLVWYFWSLGSKCCLVWCPLRPAPSSVCCSLSSFSFFGCWDVRRRRFFLFLSLSGAGEPQTPAGFVFPLVFLRPGRGLRHRPVPLHFLLHQGFAPHLFFFLFSSSSLVCRLGVFLVSCLGTGWFYRGGGVRVGLCFGFLACACASFCKACIRERATPVDRPQWRPTPCRCGLRRPGLPVSCWESTLGRCDPRR